jgi:hypothetical protein
MDLKELRFGFSEGFLLSILVSLFDGVFFVFFFWLFKSGNLRPLENETLLLSQDELDHLLDTVDLPKVPPDLHLPGLVGSPHEPLATISCHLVEESRTLGENPISVFNVRSPE